MILKTHNLTFNDALIDFNGYTICVILHARITYGYIGGFVVLIDS